MPPLTRLLSRILPATRLQHTLLRPRPPDIQLPRLAVRPAHNKRTLTPPAHVKHNNGSGNHSNSASHTSESPDAPAFSHKRTRSSTVKSSLRRAASISPPPTTRTHMCTAYCTAEKYDLTEAYRILKRNGYLPDPFKTGFGDEVIHLRIGLGSQERTTIPPAPPVSVGPEGLPVGEGEEGQEIMELGGRDREGQMGRHPLDDETAGDIFIFPSGNLVSWSVPEPSVSQLALTLQSAASNPYTGEIESEDLEYTTDPSSRRSHVRGDIIVLGTEPSVPPTSLILAKVAFSSGLARSTKLAWLEDKLNTYLESIRDIPNQFTRGGRLTFSRSFILRKTGELLSFRADLNLYSELTDSLPDIFWDSRHELGLEGYYEGVGRALDVESRIGALNRKLDYATEIVGVLRERLSELQGLWLEWCIILLIAVEVGFEIMRIWKERKAELRELAKEKREMEKERMEREVLEAAKKLEKTAEVVLTESVNLD